ncbi:hypothetical protein LF1_49140 [Rubripirellula obstinata]|uniref:Uncharacterized protein n=1 Tax=Rubripirellula obstinata TaxID=406547 RepID=A0A5B1CRS6_9BACT|nr:hypothetical protein LF1_49140 [Rubripirellula obstinata]
MRGETQRREEFWSRQTRVSSFNRVGIAPRVVLARTRGAMPTRLNNLETLHGVGRNARGAAHAVKRFIITSRRWTVHLTNALAEPNPAG